MQKMPEDCTGSVLVGPAVLSSDMTSAYIFNFPAATPHPMFPNPNPEWTYEGHMAYLLTHLTTC